MMAGEQEQSRPEASHGRRTELVEIASGSSNIKGGGRISLPFRPPSPTPILNAAAATDEDDDGGGGGGDGGRVYGLAAAAGGGRGRPKWPTAPASSSREAGPEGAADTGTPTPMMPLFDNVYNEEEEEEEDAFAFSKRSTLIPSRSGCWSSFSWSSLYERRTESSLSWADDELEREASETVRDLFEDIDDVLFADGGGGKTTPGSSRGPMSEELRQECGIWSERFPHIRLLGTQAKVRPAEAAASAASTEVPNPQRKGSSATRPPSRIPRPKSKTAKRTPPPPSSGFASKSAKSQKTPQTPAVLNAEELLSEIQGRNNDDVAEVSESSNGEEIFAADGPDDVDSFGEEVNLGLVEGLTVNQRFEERPRSYFEEKVMTAVFRKAWSQLWPEISPVASIYGERVIEESIEMLSLSSSRESSAATATRMQQRQQAPYGGRNNIAAIDENSVFQNDDDVAATTLYNDYFYPGDGDPVSLPNLGRYRPVASSAPPVRVANLSSASHQASAFNKRQPVQPQRFRRTNSLKGEKKFSAPATTLAASPPPPQSGRLSRHGDRAQQQSGTAANQIRGNSGLRRMRSRSGSPPGNGKFRMQPGQQLPTAALPQQPLSLPPIQGTTILGTGAVFRSAALPSASSSEAKPSSPSYGSAHSGFSLSTGKVPLSGLMSSGIKIASAQPPPTAPPPQGTRPLQPLSPSSLRAFSVSGRRLKSLKQPAAPTPLPPPNASHPQHQSLEQQRELQHQHGLHEPLLQQQRISLSSAGNRASSRLSMNGPMHWDARTSNPDARYRN